MALEWNIDGEFLREYSADDIFTIEDAASTYFSELLAERSLSAFQAPNRFVDLAVDIREQILTGDNMVIETTLNVYHIGDSGIADLTDLLRFVTNKNTTGSEDFLVLDSLIGMGVKVGMVSFSNAKQSSALAGGFESFYLAEAGAEDSKYSEGEKTLIVVVSVLSFALFALSVILIWVAGGWLALRRQVEVLIQREEELTRMTQGIEQKPTEDTDEDLSPRNNDDDGTQFTNPSGILGGNPYYGKSTKTFEGLGVKMTPTRSRHNDPDSGIETPMSEYSDSDRMPIGITSMRKLLANRNEQDTGPGAYGVKTLHYDD
jgi:hypothetical protein